MNSPSLSNSNIHSTIAKNTIKSGVTDMNSSSSPKTGIESSIIYLDLFILIAFAIFIKLIFIDKKKR